MSGPGWAPGCSSGSSCQTTWNGVDRSNPSVRDALELGVYLCVVLIALIISLEQTLDEGGEVFLIWGTSLGLTLAHIFAFRLASTYQLGVSFSSGWRSIWAMAVAALAVGVTATTPYVAKLDLAKPSTVSTWLLMLIVGIVAYLAAQSRGWPLIGRLAYALLILVVAASVSLTKYMLTH